VKVEVVEVGEVASGRRYLSSLPPSLTHTLTGSLPGPMSSPVNQVARVGLGDGRTRPVR
jgi:hypothetical protein